MASAYRLWSSAMGRAMTRAALAGSNLNLTSSRAFTCSPAHRRLLHGGHAPPASSPSHRTSTSKEEEQGARVVSSSLKETGTKSMEMATLDQTLDSVNSALSGVMSRRAERAYANVGVVIIGFTVGVFSATPASPMLSKWKTYEDDVDT